MSKHNNDDPNTPDTPDTYDDQYATEFDDTYDESQDVTADDDTYTDDVASDEWAEESEDPPSPPPKKKSKMTTVIIIAVAIIGVLGFMVMKGGNKQQTAQPGEMAAAPVSPPPLPDAGLNTGTEQSPTDAGLAGLIDAQPSDPQQQIEPPQPVEPQQAPQGLMDNPDILTEQPAQLPVQTMTGIELPQPTAPVPPAPQQDVMEQAPPAAPAALTDAMSAVAPDVKPVSDFPTVDSIKKPQMPLPSAEVDEEPVAPPVASEQSSEQLAPSPAQSTDLQNRLDEATVQISNLKKDLSLKDEEIRKQKEQLNTPNPELETLKQKIAELESRLSKQNEAVQVRESNQAELDEPKIVKPAAPPQKEKIKTSPVSSGKKATEKKVVWTMKSAKPGRAVLADAKTGDLKTVSVGDTLSGVGKVTSIAEGPTGWVVQGTQGKISE